MTENEKIIEVKNLRVGYGRTVILKDLDFTVRKGEVFGILGGSGCGKSTLLKHLIGLYPVTYGSVRMFGTELGGIQENDRRTLQRRFGVTYQNGALFGSMTVGENVALPLEEFTTLSRRCIREKVAEKLELVGLQDAVNKMPSELSGGMCKRAGLARAMALDPELLFFDEPSAGLDPITSVALDELILSLKNKLGTTIVIVTHELASIFTTVDNAIMLNRDLKGIADCGSPEYMKDHSGNSWVRNFLNRRVAVEDIKVTEGE